MRPLTVETMRVVAAQAGFEWTDAELEAIRPGLERSFDALARFEALGLEPVEPVLQYRPA